MKAKELFHSKNGELKHKVRTVRDLIRFIETKENKDVSNYSIFLGAGASRSSGVSTAHELISVWMRELYERYQGETFQTSDDENDGSEHTKLVRFFEKEHSSWFDASNAYSSLFERKFDLAPQRRRFVEQEVDGKLPSIGYAYLVSLVENNFFNAIFTTNFDDLLNEAFYQLSSTRPIVCAHDSSVHSISVSSKRPKIIKLHGDYLFENIKSTLRETESLEVNTKDKLIEFCKEYGLIVLGYSGNDRSIMDVLDYLIKNDTYLRNGVYWCIRNDDEISPTLKNLFWKERIYPVLIDGFDEFFAEVHHHLLPNTNFLNNYKESKQQKIIQRILENREIYNSEYIVKDITYLEFESERQDFSYFLTEDIDMPDDITKLKTTIRSTKKLIEIDKLASESIEDAYSMAKKFLSEESSEVLRNRLLQSLINFSLQLKENDDYNKWVSLLIESDPYRFDFYKIKLDNINKVEDKYFLALDLMNNFSSDFNYYNYIINLGLNTFDSYKTYRNNDFLDNISKYIETSLKLNPSLDNGAWKYKIRFLHKKHSLVFDKFEKDKVEQEAYNFVQKAKKINPHDIDFLGLEVYFVNLFDANKHINSLIDDLFLNYKQSNKANKANILHLLNNLFKNVDLEIPFDKKVEFYKDLVTLDESTPIEPIVTKIEILFLNKADNEKLAIMLDKLVKRPDFLNELEEIVDLARYIDSDLIDKIENILKAKSSDIKPKYYHNFLSVVYAAKSKFEESLKSLDRQYEYQPLDGNYFSRKSYLLLKNKSYEEVINLKEEYDSNEFDFEKSYDVLTINSMYANKILNDVNYDEDLLRNFSSSENKLIRVASRLLIDKTRNQALQNINAMIKADPRNYLIFDEWELLTFDELASIRDKIEINKKINNFL